VAPPLWGLAAGVPFVAIFSLRGAIIRRRGRDAVAQPAVGGFEIEDVLYLIAPLTWLGGLEPFLVAAGIGAPLYALWAARSYRLGTSPAAPPPSVSCAGPPPPLPPRPPPPPPP